jgi:hypothetical protein
MAALRLTASSQIRTTTGTVKMILDDETRRLAMAIFERVTAERIVRDGTTSTHSPHDAAASIEAAKVFMRAVMDAQAGSV